MMWRRVAVAGLLLVSTAVPALAAEGDAGSVGVVGCSNTVQATLAYTDQSDVDLLANTARWGTSVSQWASSRNQRFWQEYDAQRPADGYAAAWVNLCSRVSKRDGTVMLNQAQLDAVLVKIWERDPGIVVYVNPLNFFTDEGCGTSGGNTTPNAGVPIADGTAAAHPLVERAPDLGPIEGDPCHLTEADKQLVGSQLVAFFDE